MLKGITATFVALLAVYALTALAPVAPLDEATLPEATEYMVDATHSNVMFKVRHRGVSWFFGRFNEFEGAIIESEDLAKSGVAFEVKATSIDTRSAKLDGHLRSPDFFDVENHPMISFTSTKVSAGEDDDKARFKVKGELTLLGVTKEVDVDLEKVGENAGRRGKTVGYIASFTIDRGEFGMDYGLEGDGVGREVEMTISVEAAAR